MRSSDPGCRRSALGVSTPATQAHLVAVLWQRLREFGWIEGRTIEIEYRWAEGRDS